MRQRRAPVKSVAELVAYAKANPAKANYASSSAAFQLATELFKLKTGAPLEHIPYKSSGEMLTAVRRRRGPDGARRCATRCGPRQGWPVRALAITSARAHRGVPRCTDHD